MNFYAKIISIILISSIVVALPAVSLAQQGQLLQAEPSKVAMQALGLAKHYYSKGQFEKAAELFMEAHQLDARVEFMFNAARAYQRAIKLKRAKALFNRCLKTKEAPAVVVEKANIYLREIENMEKALHQAKHDGEKEASDAYVIKKPKAVPTKKEPKQEWKGTIGSTTLGLGTVVATVGAYLLLNSYELSRAAVGAADVGEIDYGEYDRQKTKAEKLNVIGWGTVGLGAVTAGFGIWCLTTQPNDVAVVPTPRGVSVAVRF
jgi:tetratricopeptide (TPR) repeat protein